jgi:hypothetical protein
LSGSAFGRDSSSSSRATIQGAVRPDALYLAAAMNGGGHLFLLNDHRLGGFLALTVEILP